MAQQKCKEREQRKKMCWLCRCDAGMEGAERKAKINRNRDCGNQEKELHLATVNCTKTTFFYSPYCTHPFRLDMNAFSSFFVAMKYS